MLPGRTICGEAGRLMLLPVAQQQAKMPELSFYPRLQHEDLMAINRFRTDSLDMELTLEPQSGHLQPLWKHLQ